MLLLYHAYIIFPVPYHIAIILTMTFIFLRRAGCEWIDVEACWSDYSHAPQFAKDARLHYSRTSRLLGSLHVTGTVTDQEAEEMYHRTR